MGKVTAHLMGKGIADSTHRAYGSAQRRFVKFCADAGLLPVLATEQVLCWFVAYLKQEGLKHRTIKSYLSAVRFLHVMEGEKNPFEGTLNRLEYVLKGVKREESESGMQKRVHLPISLNILRRIKAV